MKTITGVIFYPNLVQNKLEEFIKGLNLAPSYLWIAKRVKRGHNFKEFKLEIADSFNEKSLTEFTNFWKVEGK